eukprot:7203747-Lingulodinium_polyedra.AAC.1
MKMTNKGRLWADTIQHLRKACQEMKREKEKENATPMGSKKKKKEVLSMAKEMFAKTFLECIQEGGLL